MNKSIVRKICVLQIFALLFFHVPSGRAQMPSGGICGSRGIAVGFFNGVLTTPASAKRTAEELAILHGVSTQEGEAIQYEPMYNYTNELDDFVETFDQRVLEQGNIAREVIGTRYELFFEAANGGGPWWKAIVDGMPDAADIIKSYADFAQAEVARILTARLRNPPTEINYAEHRTRIANWILEGKKMLFVAHSQGNLFANVAYQYAVARVPVESVKLVHIAPASPQLNGPHTLADLDLVINALRLAGSAPPITDMIPGYLFRPPGVTGETDLKGHGILEIYLNQKLAISTRVKGHINDALLSLVAPPVQGSPGTFTVTLTWDGTGDVDLHTDEPGGAHVFYGSKIGQSGYLDVDNTSANGPEHYFASCDPAMLAPGNYLVAIANYSQATGRTATVQVASWRDGVLGTKSVVLGPPSGSEPGYALFNVIVFKNPLSGEFTVSLQ